ncbi:MAG: YihY/virulence factor BrkB family protein [Solirubrobacterales bacterium]|nr:YihY/virulence factor BrkB family protein [Solirubrobacterales bacterium]
MSFDRASGTRQAAQLSFFVLMTFPALLLLAVWVLSNVFDTANVREDLIKFIIDNLPVEEVEGRQEITKFLNGLTNGAGSLGLLTVGVLLYSGSAAMGAMRHAVETANENSADGPSFPKNKGLDILITAVTLPFALVFVALLIARPVNSAINDETFFSNFSATFGGPVGIFLFGVIFFSWMFWILNPGKTPWASTLIGAATAATLVGAVSYGLRLWFAISGGGSAVYGALTGFIGLLIFLNLASMGIVYGAHIAATFRIKPWRRSFLLRPKD